RDSASRAPPRCCSTASPSPTGARPPNWRRTWSRLFSDSMTSEVPGAYAGPEIEGFIRHLPKAELHVHHVGSASARIVSELADRHPGTVPSDLEELKRFYEFRDFAHFVEV